MDSIKRYHPHKRLYILYNNYFHEVLLLKLLDNDKSPSRKVKQLDNRGSTFYIALYWAEAMAKHDESFAPMAKQLVANEAKIVQELIDCQGPSVDIGGYWKPDVKKCIAAMRASPTFNAILDV